MKEKSIPLQVKNSHTGKEMKNMTVMNKLGNVNTL
jgi:hypothetical protein